MRNTVRWSDFIHIWFLASSTILSRQHLALPGGALPVWPSPVPVFIIVSHHTTDACTSRLVDFTALAAGRRMMWLTLLCCGHCSNSAWWPMSAWVWCNTGAGIVVAVRCHSKRQGLEVRADLLCQVSAQVRSVAMGLSFSICKRAGAKVGSSFCVLEKANNGLRIL